MKSKLVVKDNALVDASFNLSLVEQRMMLLAIVEAREKNGLSPSTAIEISAQSYIKQFNGDESSAYKSLAAAAKTLKRREFTYFDRYKNHDAITVAGWVNRISYVKSMGAVVIYLSEEVISLISRLDEQFTRYHLEQVSEFDSKYSIRLYEMLIKWEGSGAKVKFSIVDLRDKLGVGVNEYKTMSLLKKNVLDKAVNEISLKSDLKISYEQFRTGRTITDLEFTLKSKRVIKQINRPSELKFEMKPKQIALFASRLAHDRDFGSKHAKAGETLENFELRVITMLESKMKRFEFKDDLIRLGYGEK